MFYAIDKNNEIISCSMERYKDLAEFNFNSRFLGKPEFKRWEEGGFKLLCFEGSKSDIAFRKMVEENKERNEEKEQKSRINPWKNKEFKNPIRIPMKIKNKEVSNGNFY
jgi:hypothetical protein